METETERHIEAARLVLIAARADRVGMVRLLTEELSAVLTRFDEMAKELERLREKYQDWS